MAPTAIFLLRPQRYQTPARTCHPPLIVWRNATLHHRERGMFKYDRITAPPVLVLTGEGLGATYAHGAPARERSRA